MFQISESDSLQNSQALLQARRTFFPIACRQTYPPSGDERGRRTQSYDDGRSVVAVDLCRRQQTLLRTCKSQHVSHYFQALFTRHSQQAALVLLDVSGMAARILQWSLFWTLPWFPRRRCSRHLSSAQSVYASAVEPLGRNKETR